MWITLKQIHYSNVYSLEPVTQVAKVVKDQFCLKSCPIYIYIWNCRALHCMFSALTATIACFLIDAIVFDNDLNFDAKPSLI